MAEHYKAPWSTLLVVISTLATVVCLGTAIVVAISCRGAVAWTALLPIAILVGAAPFVIRGYSVTDDAILVHRLFWTTRLQLAGLQSARSEPDAMRRSIRTCGNGGLFSFTGFYRNKLLGSYRAYVTDPHRTVVLQYADRTVVVSPEKPEEFVDDLAVANHAGC